MPRKHRAFWACSHFYRQSSINPEDGEAAPGAALDDPRGLQLLSSPGIEPVTSCLQAVGTLRRDRRDDHGAGFQNASMRGRAKPSSGVELETPSFEAPELQNWPRTLAPNPSGTPKTPHFSGALRKRRTGVEPATSSLGSSRSTN